MLLESGGGSRGFKSPNADNGWESHCHRLDGLLVLEPTYPVT